MLIYGNTVSIQEINKLIIAKKLSPGVWKEFICTDGYKLLDEQDILEVIYKSSKSSKSSNMVTRLTEIDIDIANWRSQQNNDDCHCTICDWDQGQGNPAN